MVFAFHSHVLANFKPKMSAYAERALRELGVDVTLHCLLGDDEPGRRIVPAAALPDVPAPESWDDLRLS